MAKLKWDQTGERMYETGTDRGVLFVMGTDGKYGSGVAWNGLTAVSESPSGAEANPQYADNIKYLNLQSTEDFGCTIEAFMSPEEFDVCDGTASLGKGIKIGQQPRRMFGFSYRTIVGNDIEGQNHGYKIHLIYSATAAPSEKAYQTVNDSPEAITFSWEVTTTPIDVPGFKPTASLTIDSTKTDATIMAQLEALIYGTEDAESTLPTPEEVIAILEGGEVEEAVG